MTATPPVDADLQGADDANRPAARLLLVDDEPGLRAAVQAYLEDEGFVVTTAVDGLDGRRLEDADLVIMTMMPRCDGYGLLEKMRADERLGGTPVIFLTAKMTIAPRVTWQGLMTTSLSPLIPMNWWLGCAMWCVARIAC